MATKREVFRLLDTNYDGTGTKNAVGDYASTETHFGITDPNHHFHINRMLVQIEDSGAFTTDGYGAIAGGTITNGIVVKLVDANEETVVDFTDGVSIKSNNDWARVCYDVKLENWASGNGAVHVRWTFKNAGYPILVAKGHHFEVSLNDNFTGLVSQYFMVEGFSGPRTP